MKVGPILSFEWQVIVDKDSRHIFLLRCSYHYKTYASAEAIVTIIEREQGRWEKKRPVLAAHERLLLITTRAFEKMVRIEH